MRSEMRSEVLQSFERAEMCWQQEVHRVSTCSARCILAGAFPQNRAYRHNCRISQEPRLEPRCRAHMVEREGERKEGREGGEGGREGDKETFLSCFWIWLSMLHLLVTSIGSIVHQVHLTRLDRVQSPETGLLEALHRLPWRSGSLYGSVSYGLGPPRSRLCLGWDRWESAGQVRVVRSAATHSFHTLTTISGQKGQGPRRRILNPPPPPLPAECIGFEDVCLYVPG